MSNEIEKRFEHFLHLPPEIRMMMIEKMEPEAKCRLTRCSMICNKEAKNSKNYIYSMQIVYYWDGSLCISIRHSKTRKGYQLKFQKHDYGINYMIYYDSMSREYWRKKLDDLQDVFVFGAEKFKKLLEIHQTKIRCLMLIGTANNGSLKNFDFGIKNLNNLEKLSLNHSVELSEIIPKLRRPLNRLYIHDKIWNPSDFQEIYKVENSLEMRDTKLTYEQLLRLSASKVILEIGDLTEMDIHNFIKSWQNGTLGREVKDYKWIREFGSSFNIPKLLRLFGASFEQIQFRSIDVYNKSGICAKLSFLCDDFPILTFEVKIDQQVQQ